MSRLAGLLDLVENKGEEGLRHQNPFIKQVLELKKHVLVNQDDVEAHLSGIQTQKLYLEVGCYYGRNLVELAAHVGTNAHVLGLDITYKRIAKSAFKIEKMQLKNVKVCFFEAQDFFNLLPDNRLNGLCIFFPDPWEKKKQRKNRLLSPNFCKLLNQKMAKKGWIWFKSDHLEYFESTVSLMGEVGLTRILDGDQILPTSLVSSGMVTEFECLFMKQGKATYQAIFEK